MSREQSVPLELSLSFADKITPKRPTTILSTRFIRYALAIGQIVDLVDPRRNVIRYYDRPVLALGGRVNQLRSTTINHSRLLRENDLA